MNTLNFYKNRILVMALSILILYVPPASAHLRWFAEDSQKRGYLYNDLVSYSLIWIGVGITLIIIGIFIDKILPKVSAPWQPTLIEKYATSILGIFVGASLIISALDGNVFSMNIKDTGALHTVLLLCEGFIGVSLVFGLAVRQASLLLIALWLVATLTAGLVVTLENLWVLGAAIFFFLRGRPLLRYSREDIFPFLNINVSQAQALTFLRIFIGANLIFLGFSEKIMVPELGLSFLQEHQWNFMKHLGLLWFADDLFVFSAGAVEIILGIFLVAGLAVRLTAAVLAILFLTPPFFMGPAEMIGHIPHISIVAMLLLFGRGCTFTVAFTALVAMLKHIKISKQTLSEDALQDQPMTNIMHSLPSHSPLENLYDNGIHQKIRLLVTLSRTRGILSSLPDYDMKNRYERVLGAGKNTDIYHRPASPTKRYNCISRLSRNRYLPLAAGRQRGQQWLRRQNPAA